MGVGRPSFLLPDPGFSGQRPRMLRILPLAFVALLVGCAQPAPLLPQKPAPAPVAAVPTPAASTPAPRVAAEGEVRVVGEPKPECAACWTLPEILGTLVAAILFILALVRLYRRKG